METIAAKVCRQTFAICIFSFLFFVPERFAKQVKPPALIVKILGDYVVSRAV
jgi:hypothetical protein